MRQGFWRRLPLAVCVAALAGQGLAEPQGITPQAALPLLLKALTFDRNFASRGQVGPFVVLVAGEVPQRGERDAIVAELARMKELKAGPRAVAFASVELKDEAGLDAAVQQHRAGAILAIAGTSEAGVKKVREVSMDNQIYSLGMDSKMALAGLALTVTENEGHLQPVVNVSASLAVGAVFELSLLKLAKVVKESAAPAPVAPEAPDPSAP